MTKMLRVTIISVLLLSGVATVNAFFSSAWNFKNERIFGKVKKVETVVESDLQKYVEYYNEKGQKTRIEDYSGKGSKLRSTYTMEYNKDGDLFRVSNFRREAKKLTTVETAEYASKGVIKRIIFKAIEGKKEMTFKAEPFEYDEKKRLKSIKMKAKGELGVFNYKFDDKGNCTESIKVFGEKRRIEIKYGKYHNGVPQTTESHSRGKKSTSSVFKYKFDKAGNWIDKASEMTFYRKDKDGKPKTSTRTIKYKRTITYYPEEKLN